MTIHCTHLKCHREGMQGGLRKGKDSKFQKISVSNLLKFDQERYEGVEKNRVLMKFNEILN